jgi:hypothetical protein
VVVVTFPAGSVVVAGFPFASNDVFVVAWLRGSITLFSSPLNGPLVAYVYCVTMAGAPPSGSAIILSTSPLSGSSSHVVMCPSGSTFLTTLLKTGSNV